MSTTVITGENIFRAHTTILPADILTLDTVPISLVPAIAGKVIAPIATFYRFIYAGSAYVVGTGRAEIFFGYANSGVAAVGANEVINALVTSKTASQFKSLVATSLAAGDLTAVEGLGLFLVETATGFAGTTGGTGSTIEIDVLYQVLP